MPPQPQGQNQDRERCKHTDCSMHLGVYLRGVARGDWYVYVCVCVCEWGIYMMAPPIHLGVRSNNIATS